MVTNVMINLLTLAIDLRVTLDEKMFLALFALSFSSIDFIFL